MLFRSQYAVYSLMYEADEGTGELVRIYCGEYADLRQLTGLSKRGIQNMATAKQARDPDPQDRGWDLALRLASGGREESRH